MARRNRKGPKVVWLPPTNKGSFPGNISTWQSVFLNVAGPTGTAFNTVEPCVIDGDSQDPLAVGATLSDIENSGYHLRRIVGKMYCSVGQEATPSPALYGLSAGLIVLRCEVTTGLPISTPDTYAPDNIRNSGDPWIFRRTWILANSLSSQWVPDDPFINVPARTNAAVGGNSDGPHVDQKTARIIGPEERLFWSLGVTLLKGGDQETTGSVRWVWDMRYLASMRANVGNRRNASR